MRGLYELEPAVSERCLIQGNRKFQIALFVGFEVWLE